MDFYFRLLCIAAYRRISKSSQNDFNGYKKEEICAALLDVCPPDPATLRTCHHDQKTQTQNSMLRLMFPSGMGGYNRLIGAPKVDRAALESDSGLRGKLAAIGLEPMADWVAQGCQTGAIPGWIIVTCAAMFTEYLGEVPRAQEELEGTPYLETKDIADNLEDNGCVNYRDTLEPCFRNTARFGNEVT
ncbi:hypothetical protein WJX79_008737 [Trebouxia sp. C0005]